MGTAQRETGIFQGRAWNREGTGQEWGARFIRETGDGKIKGDRPGNRARICKRLLSSGIDSEESISPAFVAWRAGTKNRVVVPVRQAGNRFLVSLKGLQVPAQNSEWTRG
jgi:hypothetical protein